MLKREWGVERNRKQTHLFIPSKTAPQIPEFGMEDLPLGRIAALVPEFAVKGLPLGRTLMMMDHYYYYCRRPRHQSTLELHQEVHMNGNISLHVLGHFLKYTLECAYIRVDPTTAVTSLVHPRASIPYLQKRRRAILARNG